jgi:hypothetical protein
MNDEVGQLFRSFFILHNCLWLSPFHSGSSFNLAPVVNPVAKRWHYGADIPVCFFLVKQEGKVLICETIYTNQFECAT